MSAAASCLETILDPCYALPADWYRADVEIKHRDGKITKRVEVIDSTTGIRYLDEPIGRTALKCFALTIGIPILTGFYIMFQAIRAVSLIAVTLFRAVQNVYQHPSRESLLRFAIDLFCEVPAISMQTSWNVVTAPLYALPMICAAFYGIFKPLQGRIWVGNMERAWRGSPPQLDPWHRSNEAEANRACASVMTDRHSPYVLYFAYCFQPYDSPTVSIIPKV